MLDVDIEDRIATITLNRPKAMNTLTVELRKALTEAWKDLEADPEVLVVIVTGTGDRAFCAGSDLTDAAADELHLASMMFGPHGDPWRRELEFEKPMIAAINGHALGGGLELALSCDIRIAVPHATLGLPEVRVGTMPGAGGTQALPRAIGLSNAMYLLLTGERITAERAERIGLITEIVEPERLMARAYEIARVIAGNAPLSIRAVKRLAKSAFDLPLLRGYEAERTTFGLIKTTHDRAEGRQAFRDKRPPDYQGR